MTSKAEAKLVALSAATERARQRYKRAERKREEAERKLQEIQHFRLEWLIDRARDVIDKFDRFDSDDFYLARPRWKDLSRLAPMVRKAKRRAEASRDAAGRVNESRQTEKKRRKQIARKLADKLLKTDVRFRWPRKKWELARRVRAAWPDRNDAPAANTIRHWLAE
jgi:hypothetical protein